MAFAPYSGRFEQFMNEICSPQNIAATAEKFKEFNLTLKENKVVVEDDLFSLVLPKDEQEEVPMSFDGSIPPDYRPAHAQDLQSGRSHQSAFGPD